MFYPVFRVGSILNVVFDRGFIGPPVGGALFGRFGIRGPFIFSILVTAVDFLLRCLIIERKNAILYGIDPAAPPQRPEDAIEEECTIQELEKADAKTGEETVPTAQANTEQKAEVQQAPEATDLRDQPLSLLGVLKVFLKSPRALATIFNTLTYGYV